MRTKIIGEPEDGCVRRRAALCAGWGQLRDLCAVALLAVVTLTGSAQTAPPRTGPQKLAFAGLRAVATAGVPPGAIHAVAVGPDGALYLLIDQNDGVRLLKTDAAGANVLAQAQIGAKGDIGAAMALDPAGDVYVTGTTSSGAMTATAGAAFLTAFGTAVNSFVAKFDTNLNTYVPERRGRKHRGECHCR